MRSRHRPPGGSRYPPPSPPGKPFFSAALCAAEGLLPHPRLFPHVAPSSRQLVRNAVGLAVVAPAVALLGLAVSLAVGGGLSGLLAGAVVAFLACLILGAAFVMTHAPVSVSNLLSDEVASEDEQGGGTNGHAGAEVELQER